MLDVGAKLMKIVHRRLLFLWVSKDSWNINEVFQSFVPSWLKTITLSTSNTDEAINLIDFISQLRKTIIFRMYNDGWRRRRDEMFWLKFNDMKSHRFHLRRSDSLCVRGDMSFVWLNVILNSKSHHKTLICVIVTHTFSPSQHSSPLGWVTKMAQIECLSIISVW